MPTQCSDSGRLLLVTCSMPGDLEIFSVLARSIDECISGDLRHVVIVPGQSVKSFQQFATSNREIVAQEDLLPMRLFKLPTALKHLSFVSQGFRRPIYLNKNLNVVRGWIIQQLLKIEISRQAPEAAVMHIDSDVFFFRDLAHDDAFTERKPHFFRATDGQPNPTRDAWTENASRLLGVELPGDFSHHYIENCVVWGSDVLRQMIAHIENVQERSFHQAMIGANSMSEYHIYGIYSDYLGGSAALHSNAESFCNSIWPQKVQVDYMKLLNERMIAKHRAISIQSTHEFSIEQRIALYQQARNAYT